MIIIFTMLVGLAGGSTGEAQETPRQGQQQESAAAVEALKRFLESLFGYGTPEMRPNGDIVIPRREGPPRNERRGEKEPDTMQL